MSGIGIITNPHSKLNLRYPERQKLLSYILGEQGKLRITNTLDELSLVAQDFRDRGVSILAINGGDGTISRTLTTLIEEYKDVPLPKIALLRGGTMNVVANNLGIKGSPEQILYRLVEAYSTGANLKTVSVSTLKIEGRYGFLFGNGAVSNYLDEFYKNKTGSLGALWLIFRIYFSYLAKTELYTRLIRKILYDLTPDHFSSTSFGAVGILSSTVERMPMGPRLFPLTRSHSDKFQTLLYTMEERDVIWQLPLTMLNLGKWSQQYKKSFCSQKLLIKAPLPFRYTLDGELFESKSNELEIDLGPKLNFVVV